jgi:hypothetical protein
MEEGGKERGGKEGGERKGKREKGKREIQRKRKGEGKRRRFKGCMSCIQFLSFSNFSTIFHLSVSLFRFLDPESTPFFTYVM